METRQMTAEAIQGDAPALDAENPVEIEQIESEVTEPESSTELEQAEHEEPKQAKGVQKRLNELTANWREEQRRAQKLEAMLERVLTQQPQEKAEQPQPTGEPKLDQFQTYEEYVGALADYRADQKIRTWEAQQREREAVRQKESTVEQFQSRVQTYRAQRPDFDEVAFNPDLPVSDAMAEAINVADNGPELLYQLGKNPGEAARIAALPPIQAAVELGKFAVRMSMPQPRNKTGAPPPLRPIDSGSGTALPDPDKMTSDEWLAWRQQQLKR